MKVSLASGVLAELAFVFSMTVGKCCSHLRSDSQKNVGQSRRYPARSPFPVKTIPNFRDFLIL